jgi:hypothetical protein
LSSFDSASVYPDPLRRVSYFDAETGKRLTFLTNNFTLPALTIAQIHKQRWQVELFFENSTWCSFVCHSISRSSCLESSVGGVVARSRSALHCSTSALRITHGAPGQACVAGSCFNRISRKIVVGVTCAPQKPLRVEICMTAGADSGLILWLAKESCSASLLCAKLISHVAASRPLQA